ncbi:MAG TPA: tol-pal system-associated acyl-CoA thioesterase [Sulfuricella sp.]|nr:tol-pal system-associated acyl-CoA thioesterase [Sulfuricella sp.]
MGEHAGSTQSEAETFAWPVRVYYEDTDAGGVVYYTNYLKFMERARTEWLRAQGFEQPELLRDHLVIFVVRSVQIEYLRPALFNDLLTVSVRLHEAGRSWIELDQTVERPDGGLCREVLVKARVKIVCVNGQTFKPVQIPAPVREKLERIS